MSICYTSVKSTTNIDEALCYLKKLEVSDDFEDEIDLENFQSANIIIEPPPNPH